MKKKLLSRAFVLGSALLVVGCTTKLAVKKILPGDDQPIQGVVYLLPESEFVIDVTYRLTECPITSGQKPNVEVAADVTHKIRSSLSQAYNIDYSTLQSATKKYSFEVNLYDNGTLKSISNSTKDQTGDIIVSVASTATKLALLSAGGAPGLLAIAPGGIQSLDKSFINICKDEIQNAVTDFERVKSEEKELLKIADSEKDKVIKIREKIIEAGDRLAGDDSLKGALKILASAYEAYLIKKSEREGLEKSLVIKKTFYKTGLSTQQFDISPTELSKWFNDTDSYSANISLTSASLGLRFEVDSDYLNADILASVGTAPTAEANNAVMKNDGIDVVSGNESSFDSTVDRSGSNSSDTSNSNSPATSTAVVTKNTSSGVPLSQASSSASSRPTYEGLVYRQSTNSRIRVCVGDNCLAHKYLLSKDFMVPDAGPLAVLPFKNGPFQENSFEANFSESGALTRVKITSESAALAQAKTLEGVVDAKLDYETQKAKMQKAEKEAVQAETDAAIAATDAALKKQRDEDVANLSHQITLLTKQKELADLTAAPKVDEELVALKKLLVLEQLKNDIARLNATDAEYELDKITAERAIETLLGK